MFRSCVLATIDVFSRNVLQVSKGNPDESAINECVLHEENPHTEGQPEQTRAYWAGDEKSFACFHKLVTHTTQLVANTLERIGGISVERKGETDDVARGCDESTQNLLAYHRRKRAIRRDFRTTSSSTAVVLL